MTTQMTSQEAEQEAEARLLTETTGVNFVEIADQRNRPSREEWRRAVDQLLERFHLYYE